MKRLSVSLLLLSLCICGFARIAPKPIDKKATSETVRLYRYLRNQVWGRKVIAGCQARWDYNTTDAEEIFNAAGKYPALNIFDFQHFRHPDIDYMADTALQWHRAGGIVGCRSQPVIAKDLHRRWLVEGLDHADLRFYADPDRPPVFYRTAATEFGDAREPIRPALSTDGTGAWFELRDCTGSLSIGW